MRGLVVLALLLVPAVQACSLESEPDGPGEVAAVSLDGTTTYAFEVEERGLGADCSISIPYAIGAGHMVWIESDVLHVLELATGTHTTSPWPLGHVTLTIDDEGLLAMQEVSGPRPLHAVSWDGRTTHLRDLPTGVELSNGRIIEATPGRMQAWSLRTGAPVIDAVPAPAPYALDDLGPVATDGRYVLFEAWGQGKQPTVVWDNATGEWYLLDIDRWLWDVAVEDGIAYGATQERVYEIDLASRQVTPLGAPPEGTLAVTAGWFMTGVYAKQWREDGDGVDSPGIGIVLAPALLWAARRPRTKR